MGLNSESLVFSLKDFLAESNDINLPIKNDPKRYFPHHQHHQHHKYHKKFTYG